MIAQELWKGLGWKHVLWDLLRFYHSLRPGKMQTAWLQELTTHHSMAIDAEHHLPIDPKNVELLLKYFEARTQQFNMAFQNLRTEDQALAFCKKLKCKVDVTATKNAGHHQSSKAVVAAVSTVAGKICKQHKVEVNPNPQRRCVWCTEHDLHVSVRNLDGVIPSLTNPRIVWEIKEYWGLTSGGSKMSDAVYECHLTGWELRQFEEKSGIRVMHFVFLDGQTQWGQRKSDMIRFIDLLNQGFIDYLLVGKEIETEWAKLLGNLLDQRKT